MPFISIDGREIEIPRHVHKADGTSKIVWTAEEFETASAEGYFAEPWQAVEDAARTFDAFMTETFAAEPPVEAPEPEPEGEHEPEPEPDDPVLTDEPAKRGRGRPRKL